MSGVLLDSAALFYTLLAEDPGVISAVTNTVGNEQVLDIYGPPGLPPGWLPRKGIMFLGGGGVGETRIPLGHESWDVYCYGGSAAEAREVYRATRKALHRKSHDRINIDGETYIFEFAQIMSGPQDRVDPLENWNFVFCSFYIQFYETSV